MNKLRILFLFGFLFFIVSNCNTPTESMEQSNPTFEFATYNRVFFKVSVNNLIGDEIKVLAKKVFNAGYHRLSWDGKNKNGDFVDEGFYHFSIYFANDKLWKTRLIYYKRS